MSSQIAFACQEGHPHCMTFCNVEFHLPIGLPLCEAVQVILQDLVIHWGFYEGRSKSNKTRVTAPFIKSVDKRLVIVVN